jgi:hypothetical protein
MKEIYSKHQACSKATAQTRSVEDDHAQNLKISKPINMFFKNGADEDKPVAVYAQLRFDTGAVRETNTTGIE